MFPNRIRGGLVVPKTLEKIQEVFDKHVRYEISRLAEMYDRLLKPELYSQLQPCVRDTITDALIVAFCIHAKNLMEFLSYTPRRDRATAEDYAGSDYRRWKIAPRTHAHDLKGKLNNQLSHLSFERTDEPNEKIGIQERKDLVDMLHDELVRWIAQLKPDYDANKLNVKALAVAKEIEIRWEVLRSASNTTSSNSAFSYVSVGPSPQG
jgi:hypothetical protein